MTLRRCACGILLKGTQILLGKRAFHLTFYPNTWDLIGGHCEIGETSRETLIREFQEEINVTPKTFTKCAVLAEHLPQHYGEGEYHVYVVTDWTGKISMLGNEHSEIRWFLLKDAISLDLAHPKYVDLFRTIQHKIEVSTELPDSQD